MNHRMVDIPASRLDRWLAGFADRNGGVPTISETDHTIELDSPGGARAHLEIPFPRHWTPPLGGMSWPLQPVVDHAREERDILVVLLRRGGYAVGLSIHDQVLFTKCGTKYVQGRTAAGGWSQQRFARRRKGQTATIIDAAAEQIVRAHQAARDCGLPTTRQPVLVIGGDRSLVDQSLADLPQNVTQWLEAFELSALRNIGDPRRKHLDEALATPCLVRIKITD